MRSKERFANNLRRLMERDGVKGIDIASQLGIKSANISRWLAGHQWPNDMYLDQLTDVFGWQIEDLFSKTPTERAASQDISLRDAIEVILRHLGYEIGRLTKIQN